MKNIQPLRLIVFMISVIALAKFFEAGRVISDEQTFTHIPMSFLSLLVLIISMLAMAYWIYEEEKKNGNLKVEFGLFEWIYKMRGTR